MAAACMFKSLCFFTRRATGTKAVARCGVGAGFGMAIHLQENSSPAPLRQTYISKVSEIFNCGIPSQKIHGEWAYIND